MSAVSAAAKAIEDVCRRYPKSDGPLDGSIGWGATPTQLAEAALGAAEPIALAEERRRIAREVVAYLDKEHAPPIWHHCVDIADPTYCIECPSCNGSWDGCEACDHGYIKDGPVGGYSGTEHR